MVLVIAVFLFIAFDFHAVMARAFAGAVALSFAGVLLQLTGLVLFVLGFFPVKPALTGIRHSFPHLSIYF